MADNKRLSLGGRVATPRLGNMPAPAMSVENAIARCIGAKIRVTTVAPASQTHEQHILALHPSSSLLVLTPTFPPATPNPRQLLIPLTAIQSFTLLALPPTPAGAPTKLPPAVAAPPPVESNLAVHRLRTAVARVRADEARRGKGVSREAQDIFDALARTLPARWDGESIVVLDAVVIAKPYRSEDCRAGKGVQPQMLQRVRKVLESERKKIAEKAGGAPGTEPWKGG